MAGMTTSTPMERIRGKDEVSRLRNPRKDIASPMSQHVKNDNQQA